MKNKFIAVLLLLTIIASQLQSVYAASIADGGSRYVNISKGHYGSYLRTTDGNKIGARNWSYTTNDGIT